MYHPKDHWLTKQMVLFQSSLLRCSPRWRRRRFEQRSTNYLFKFIGKQQQQYSRDISVTQKRDLNLKCGDKCDQKNLRIRIRWRNKEEKEEEKISFLINNPCV